MVDTVTVLICVIWMSISFFMHNNCKYMQCKIGVSVTFYQAFLVPRVAHHFKCGSRISRTYLIAEFATHARLAQKQHLGELGGKQKKSGQERMSMWEAITLQSWTLFHMITQQAAGPACPLVPSNRTTGGLKLWPWPNYHCIFIIP